MNYICIKSTEIVCDNETLVLMRYTTLAGFAFIEIWRNLRGTGGVIEQRCLTPTTLKSSVCYYYNQTGADLLRNRPQHYVATLRKLSCFHFPSFLFFSFLRSTSARHLVLVCV